MKKTTKKNFSNEMLFKQLVANMHQLKLAVELIAITNHKIDLIQAFLNENDGDETTETWWIATVDQYVQGA